MRVIVLLCLLCAATNGFAETLVYFGTYTRGNTGSRGIYVSKLNETTGELSAPVLAAETPNPSFVAIAPDGKMLYAVSEGGDNDSPVNVISYLIGNDGKLKQLNGQSSGGAGACHLSVSPDGRCVGVANYGGGSCAILPIADNGSLEPAGSFHQHTGRSVNPRRQSGPHAHSINFNASGTQAFVADLGLDQILIYDVDAAAGTMKPAKQPFLQMPAGGGPRHFCFVPGGRAAVANLEMTSQVALLRYDASEQTLSLLQVASTLPDGTDAPGNSTAECLVYPGGRFAYVSNRGHNSIAVFEVDADAGTIRPIGHQSTQGEIPRGFGIDPSGQFLIVGNQSSGNVVTFRINPQTGLLHPVGQAIEVGAPVNVRFLVR